MTKNKKNTLREIWSFLIAGKSLKELSFPEKWEYEPDMCRWRSEGYKVKMTHIGGGTRKKGEKWGEYIYITDEMLSNL